MDEDQIDDGKAPERTKPAGFMGVGAPIGIGLVVGILPGNLVLGQIAGAGLGTVVGVVPESSRGR